MKLLDQNLSIFSAVTIFYITIFFPVFNLKWNNSWSYLFLLARVCLFLCLTTSSNITHTPHLSSPTTHLLAFHTNPVLLTLFPSWSPVMSCHLWGCLVQSLDHSQYSHLLSSETLLILSGPAWKLPL